MLDVMAGPPSRDPFCLPNDGTSYLEAVQRSIDGFDVAYSSDLDVFPVEDQVCSVVEDAVDKLSETGARITEVAIGFEYSHETLAKTWRTYSQVGKATLVENLKEEQGIDLLNDHRDKLTPIFAEEIEAGQCISATEYNRYGNVRTNVFDAVEDIFETYDLLVTPTLAVPPFENAKDKNTVGPSEINGEPVDPLIGWCLTYPFNFTGHPAASVPAGLTDDGLPIGMQIIGPRFDDEAVLSASSAFEAISNWHETYPDIL